MAEPNKYAKNAKIEPNSNLSNLKAIASFGLIILGLIGLAMEFFKENGLFTRLFSFVFKSYTTMMIIPVIIGVFWVFNKMSDSTSQDDTKKAGDIPMYIMMALGAYYLFRLISTGGF